MCRLNGEELAAGVGRLGVGDGGPLPQQRGDLPLHRGEGRGQGRGQGQGRSRVPLGRDGPRPAFPTTCAACGAATTLPFEPRPGRPSYCRACFGQHRQSAPPHRPRR
ncbi:MAG: hypothetical protein H0U40_10990 [Chloroflexia bacterium]|nr:hypothetical protein [Chloroflexia bacterium]